MFLIQKFGGVAKDPQNILFNAKSGEPVEKIRTMLSSRLPVQINRADSR
jgi:hypothetical protein